MEKTVPSKLLGLSLESSLGLFACSFSGENARSWEALGEARPGQSSLSARALGPIDGSPLGSPISGILQARTLEWVAISSFRGSS